MRNALDPKISVPGDGYCGLHMCLAHALLAYQFMNSPQSHADLRAMRDALLACKNDIDALSDHGVEVFSFGSSLLTRIHDIFSGFPAWQRAWRAQLDTQGGVSKASLLRYYAEHLSNLNAFCDYSAPGAIDNSPFFRAWRDAYETGQYAYQVANAPTFTQALADYAASFVSGSIRASFNQDPTYLNLFGSFCQAYANNPTRQNEQAARIAFVGVDQEPISFHFDGLFACFNAALNGNLHPFDVGALPANWLGDEDVRMIVDRTVMPNCNFEFIGLNASNPSRVHWEITVSNGFMERTPSLDWANRQNALERYSRQIDAQATERKQDFKTDFSLVSLSTSIAVFTMAVQDLVDLQTNSASFWDTPKKMRTLQEAETRLTCEIRALEAPYYAGRLDPDENEVEGLSVAVENMRVAITDFQMHYAALNQEYARYNVLLKICIWVRDTIDRLAHQVDDSIDKLDSPVTMVACSA